MSIVIAAVVLAALIYLLHRDNSTTVDPYRQALVDRDAQRVRADIVAGGDRLRRPHQLGSLDAKDWEPRA